MRKLQLTLAAAALVFAASCGNTSNNDKVNADTAKEVTTPAEASATYNVNNATTTIEWKGSKITGSAHNGNIALKEGSIVNVEAGNVTGGKFVFDLNSLNPMDQDAEMNGKLKGHLLAPDFLDVEKFADAHFVITEVKAGAPAESKLANATHTVTGNLTLKGTEKSITFPAIINVSETEVTTVADFTFDRTQWGIVYGTDKSLGDNLINNDIEIKLNVKATK